MICKIINFRKKKNQCTDIQVNMRISKSIMVRMHKNREMINKRPPIGIKVKNCKIRREIRNLRHLQPFQWQKLVLWTVRRQKYLIHCSNRTIYIMFEDLNSFLPQQQWVPQYRFVDWHSETSQSSIEWLQTYLYIVSHEGSSVEGQTQR